MGEKKKCILKIKNQKMELVTIQTQFQPRFIMKIPPINYTTIKLAHTDTHTHTNTPNFENLLNGMYAITDAAAMKPQITRPGGILEIWTTQRGPISPPLPYAGRLRDVRGP